MRVCNGKSILLTPSQTTCNTSCNLNPMYHNWASAWDFQQFGMCDQQSLRPACAYAQPDQSLCLSLEYSMIVKLLTERHLEFLSITGGCRGPSESTLVKMSNCWKSRALVQLFSLIQTVLNLLGGLISMLLLLLLLLLLFWNVVVLKTKILKEKCGRQIEW